MAPIQRALCRKFVCHNLPISISYSLQIHRYFLQWLNGYSDPKRRKHTTSNQLSFSLAQCKETFFAPGAPLELNLTSEIARGVLENIRVAPARSIYSLGSPPLDVSAINEPYSPHLFDAAKLSVEEMLSTSLMKFVEESSGNAGWLRRTAGCIGGVAIIILGFTPILISVLTGKSRWIRLSALPPFWIGTMMVLTGYCRFCLIIFFFGDARQLHGFELARPAVTRVSLPASSRSASASTHVSTYYPPLPANKSDETDQGNLESQAQASASVHLPNKIMFDIEITPPTFQPSPKVGLQVSNKICDLKPETTDPLSGVMINDLGLPVLSHSSFNSGLFDFDAPAVNITIPNNPSWAFDGKRTSHPSSFSSFPRFTTPILAPLTRVISPIIKRVQWEIVMRCGSWSLLVTILLGVACLAIPFKDPKSGTNNW